MMALQREGLVDGFRELQIKLELVENGLEEWGAQAATLESRGQLAFSGRYLTSPGPGT